MLIYYINYNKGIIIYKSYFFVNFPSCVDMNQEFKDWKVKVKLSLQMALNLTLGAQRWSTCEVSKGREEL